MVITKNLNQKFALISVFDKGNLRYLCNNLKRYNYKFIRLDINNRTKLRKVLKLHKPTAVFNLAAETHVDRSIDGPAEFIRSNIVGVFNLLEIFREYSKKNKLDLTMFQSNIEGELVDKIQVSRNNQNGLIINAGGYTHTSVAIHDALKILKIPIIELHITIFIIEKISGTNL